MVSSILSACFAKACNIRLFPALTVGITLALCFLTYVLHVEPEWIEIVSVDVTIPHLDPAFEGTRIVQLSDIHMDLDSGWMTSQRLERIVKQVKRQNPDVVVITGDLIDHDPATNAPELIPALTWLADQAPTFAVLGNHDYYNSDSQPIHDALSKSHVVELANTVYTFTKGTAQLHLAGIDDVWMKRDRLDLVLEQLPEEGAVVLLVHEPDFADTAAATERFDLALSGHSHGGQVRIPFGGAPILPRYGKHYPLGQYQVGTMQQYTNRGIGMSRPRVRFNCRPELTVLTLSSQSSATS